MDVKKRGVQESKDIDYAKQHHSPHCWLPVKEAVEDFMQLTSHLQLPVFVVEPSLLRALKDNGSSLLAWNLVERDVITFGVVMSEHSQSDRSLDELKSYAKLYINTHDPRSLSLDKTNQSVRSLSAHYFFVNCGDCKPVIHLVIFYPRGGYVWSAPVTMSSVSGSPVNVSSITVGRHALSLLSFTIVKADVGKVQLNLPMDSENFIRDFHRSKFIECDFAGATQFINDYSSEVDTSQLSVVEFRRKVRQLLLLVSRTLGKMEISFWISSGTLLGWCRQCDVITYSRDVDIGIMISDFRQEMIQMLEFAGLKFTQQFGKVSDSFELSFMYDSVKLDIFFFYEENGYMWNGGTEASTGKKFKYYFPKFSLCWTEFLGLRLQVPDPPLTYIEANYGKKWRIPVKGWDWKISPFNVQPNGKWMPHELDDAVQLFEVND